MRSFHCPFGPGVEMPPQSLRRHLGKAQGHRTTTRRSERMCDTVTQECGTVAVRHYEATIIRDQKGWKIAGDSKIQAVGKFSIARPFAIGTKIGDGRLDLDGDQFASLAERKDIGAATVGERKFEEAGITELAERAADPARQNGGADRRRSMFEGHHYRTWR
jgi:hypothetical protein